MVGNEMMQEFGIQEVVTTWDNGGKGNECVCFTHLGIGEWALEIDIKDKIGL